MLSFLKKYKKTYIIILSCILLFFSGSISATNYDTVIDEITNSYKSGLYQLDLNAPFSKETSGIQETIDPETGSMVATVNLFTMPGRGGVDSNMISLTYSTAYASLKEETAENDGTTYVNALGEKSAFLQSIENFGIGWRMQLPYVERPDGRNNTVVYVHLADGSVYKKSNSKNGLENYKLTDVNFIEKTESRNGKEVAYRLSYVTGDTYYFNAGGYPVEKTDRIGNRVFFNWSNDSIPKLISIADDSSDIVYFEYKDGLVTIRHKEKKYTISREPAGTGWIVRKITDPMGRTTEFDYQISGFRFNFWGDATYGLANDYYLLQSVTYPTGFVSRYQYTTGTKWLYETGGGKINYAKVSERYNTDGGTRTDGLSYSYDREPDGCPSYKSDQLPANYNYTTTVTDDYDSKTTYIYDKNHDQIKLQHFADGKMYAEEIRRFDQTTRMPDMFTNTLYNKNGEKRNVYMASKFDSRGNLIYTDTYENSQDAGQNVKEYAYSAVANLCVYESSFQDADTKIEIKRTVGPGGTITSESVYQNGRRIKRDRYIYDDYNNLIESQIQNNETDILTTKYWYSAETSFQYPTEMSTIGIQNADGESDAYTYRLSYDAYGNLIERVNPDQGRITYTYDKLNRQTQERLEDGGVRNTVYDDSNNILCTTDAVGHSLLYFYDKYGKLEKVYDNTQLCYLLKRNYDAKGRVIEETDMRGTKYQYTYDGQDRYTRVVISDASGDILSEQAMQYNTAVTENGKGYTRLFLEEGAQNERRQTVYLFDYLNRQVQQTEQWGGEERSQYFAYDWAGNCIVSTAKDGAVTQYHYDIFGNQTYALLSDGTENYFTYDYNGNCLCETNGAGEEIQYAYDGLNRLTRQETTNGENRSIMRSYYDFRNNVVLTLDGENNRVEYSYDLRGFLDTVRQYAKGNQGQQSQYTYDGEGRVTSLSVGAIGGENHHVYQYTLDALGRCVKETDPMGGIAQYSYEADGNLSKSIDKNGVITEYTYDGLGRLIKETNSKNGSRSYTYNDFDQLTSVTDGVSIVKTNYNNFGDMVKVIRDRNEESFAYDIAGRVVNHTITDRDIGVLNTKYGYDVLGRTTVIETDGGTEYISYDKASRIAEKNYPQTGRKKVYDYYQDGRLKSLLQYTDGELTATENVEYDKNGNKTVWEQDGKLTKYIYDGMNRLQGVEESNGILTEYEFDGFGNITREYTLSSSGIKTKQYEYDQNNRLLLSIDDTSSTQYSYDKAGNLINKLYEISGRETESWYYYDGYNRLREYISGNTTAEYTYNSEGLRESKIVNGSSTRFVYDGANVVGELTEDNYYIYYRGTELIGSKSYDGQGYVYKQDSHGNIVGIQTPTGEDLKTYTYNAYGKEQPFTINPSGDKTILYHWQNKTDTTHNPFRYCGEYQDLCSGLIYLRNRYYDPSIGRFITEDPARDGLNWYAYCDNNPVMFVDPLGLAYRMLREEAESMGAQVTWDGKNKKVLVDFGYHGGAKWYTLNAKDDDGVGGILYEGNYYAIVEEGRLEKDFNICDYETHWDEDKRANIVATLFKKDDNFYQRLSINGSSITWEQVKYKNFATWSGGRYTITSQQVSGTYLNTENKAWLEDIINFVDAYPSEVPLSTPMTIASFLFDIFGEYPEPKLSNDDYQVVFHNRVYFFDSSMSYKYSRKEVR